MVEEQARERPEGIEALAVGVLAVPLLEVLYAIDATHAGVGGDVLGQCQASFLASRSEA